MYGWKAVTTATQTTLIWLNLAGVRCDAHQPAAPPPPPPQDRFEFGMAATLATLFAVAMVVQLVTDTDSISQSLHGWWVWWRSRSCGAGRSRHRPKAAAMVRLRRFAATVAVAVVGASGGWVAWWTGRGRVREDAEGLHVDTADQVVAMVGVQLAEMQAENVRLREQMVRTPPRVRSAPPAWR